MKRRHFLVTSAAALGTVSSHVEGVEKVRGEQPKIIGFTKSFADLSLAETAAMVEEVGWDGVDVTIRNGNTHIKPERMTEDLPKLMELLRARGKDVCVVTTNVTKITAWEEAYLRQLAACGVKKYRLGYHHYKQKDDPRKVVGDVASMLRDVAALNKELGLWGGYQNHSGATYFGGPLWDVMMAMDDTDPRDLGLCFDIAHATVEGGQNWPIQAKLVRPRVGISYVKDYSWREEKTPEGVTKWHRDAVAFGTGIVQKSFFDGLKKQGFTGEFCQHHEYFLGSAVERIQHYKRDLAKLRSWVS